MTWLPACQGADEHPSLEDVTRQRSEATSLCVSDLRSQELCADVSNEPDQQSKRSFQHMKMKGLKTRQPSDSTNNEMKLDRLDERKNTSQGENPHALTLCPLSLPPQGTHHSQRIRWFRVQTATALT